MLETKTELSKLVKLLETRQEEVILIARNGTPMVELNRPETAPAHKDPFDKIMVCQAMVENMLFVTHDHLIPDYNEPCIYQV